MPHPQRRAGPRLSEETSQVIRRAVIEVLSERGYDSLSIDGVARQASVGKAAIYRRWSGKQQMVVAIVSEYATRAELFPDTGTLDGDLDELLNTTRRYLEDPIVARIASDLIAVTARDERFARELYGRGGAERRAQTRAMLRRAIERGELAQGIDLELASDVVISPLYWRLAVTHQPITDADLTRMRRMISAAIGVLDQPGPVR